MFGPDFIERLLVWLPVLVLSLTVHEYFHAWSALKFGDTTARDAGRLTLHPLAHLDLMGSLVMVISGFRFGWAKPVPVNPYNLREPRRADFWISFAGPLSNFGMAIIAGLIFRLAVSMTQSMHEYVEQFLVAGVIINLTLGFFNMFPLFPLDGSHILRNVLPEHHGPTLDQIDRFSPFILLLLVFSGAFWYIIGPLVWFFGRILLG